MQKKIRIASGAGYGGDRIEPAVDLINKGNLDYIIFECLAERTIAIAQQQKLENPEKGYNDQLEYRMKHILPAIKKNKVKVITNMGAANPLGALKVVAAMAQDIGMSDIKIVAVTGDDISDCIEDYFDYEILETGEKVENIKEKIVSANAYIGARGIVEALASEADIIIAGRVADPSLTLGPLIHEFGWAFDDYHMLGKGTVVGHLLECGGQVTGGYYADPGYKDVPDLWNIGFPIAEVDCNGDAIITKLEGTGGVVNVGTVAEQLLYEIHDPTCYYTPDVIADFSQIVLEEIEKNKVLVIGASGKKKSGLLKVSIGYKDGYIGEGEISYGGPGAYNRARLAEEIVVNRLENQKKDIIELHTELIGYNSLTSYFKGNVESLSEIRLRVAGHTSEYDLAKMIGDEVETLYTNGPAAGGGARKYIRNIMGVVSIFIPENQVKVSSSQIII